jgi:hypothetical protein
VIQKENEEESMRRVSLTLIGVLLVSAASLIGAPKQPSESPKAETTPKPAETQSSDVYRLDYAIYELEQGKRVNTRTFTLMGRAGDWARFRVGNRVPVETGNGQYTYQDVGVNLDAHVDERASDLTVDTNIEVSSVAKPPEELGGRANPVFRSLKLQDCTLIELGKPALVGAIDDTVSNRRYEVELTVTKVK